MQKNLLFSGLFLFIMGFAWPWIQKIGLGRLPGDIVIELENFRFIGNHVVKPKMTPLFSTPCDSYQGG
ncbi:DUF2905 domain-containing protein [candidate division KSB1 bacterium]|nr:DUF2905 domain-containing protein [candidate division KSB1 bacterium]